MQNTQVLISKRHKNSHQGGRWEFPGGKVEKHELKEHALSRELKEELNISVVDSLFFKKIEFDYGDKQVELLFYFIRRYEGRERGLEGQQIRWVNLNELGEYLFPEANQPVVDALVTGLF
ncbi:MAG: 8-oxo-dGTP diphosphatase MutT [Kangiellaceae bacterium]|nr:8-oxo-dGTP diphosphatase MutT [Kangiellaceae bacterium]